jgi:acetyl-CoA C-acetyltransferase
VGKGVYILGGYQSDFARNVQREGKDYSDLIAEAVHGALEDAQVDVGALETVHVGNAMGELYNGQAHFGPIVAQVVPALRGLPTMRHEGACASSSLAILAAAAEIEAGRYDCALVVGVEQERILPGIEAGMIQNSAGWLERENMDDAKLMWAAVFGRIAQEYDARYGLDHKYLSRIAEINYGNAKDNPRAQTRSWQFGPGSFAEDDEANPVIEPGTRRTDCTHITDGAVALILASEEFAAAHLKRIGKGHGDIARIKGWGHRGAGIRFLDKLEANSQPYMMPHVRQAITDAWKRAGVPGLEAIDGIETHDCFSATEYLAIDHFGITEPGQSWKAIEEGWIERDGRIPVNASGGLIGIGHPIGATGARMTLDAARQVTNRAEGYQIPDAKTCQTLNIGGSLATVVSLILDTAE